VRVLWLSLAVDDLETIVDFIAQDNPAASAGEAEKVLDVVGRLAAFPSSGRPGRVPGTRELIVSSYIIAYRVKGDDVQILRVLHAARTWPEDL